MNGARAVQKETHWSISFAMQTHHHRANQGTAGRPSETACEETLAERGLTLSAEKTRITHVRVGFDFLGHNIQGTWRADLLHQAIRHGRKGLPDRDPGHREG